MVDIFCETRWKLTSATLVVIGLGLFVWAFIQYKDHGILYGPKEIQPEGTTPDLDLQTALPPQAINIANRTPQVSAFPTQVGNSVVSLITFDPVRNVSVRSGSGVLLSDHGHFVTALHQISDASVVSVQLKNHTYKAQVLRRVPEHNLVLLKIISDKTFPFSVINDQLPEAGTNVFSVGRSDKLVISEGHIQKPVTSLKTGNRVFTHLIQVHATHHYIQNGGGLFNAAGEFIGINLFAQSLGRESHILALSAHEVNLNFMDIIDFVSLANFKNRRTGNSQVVQNNTAPLNGQNSNTGGMTDFPNIRSMDLVSEDYHLWIPLKEFTEKIYHIISFGQ